MALTDAQKRAMEKYRKANVKQLSVRFYPADADVWEWLQAQPNRQGYVRDLIRADMERQSGQRKL